MSMPAKLLLFSLGLALAACQSDSAVEPGSSPSASSLSAGEQGLETPKTERAEARIRFASSLDDAKAGSFRTSFPLFGQRDIVAKIEFPKRSLATGATLLHFEVINASGVAHASKWYAIGVDSEGPQSIRHPLFDRDIRVQVLEGAGEQGYFFGKIPVAGTNFTRNRLHGEFTAKVSLGVDAAEATISQVFEVQL